MKGVTGEESLNKDKNVPLNVLFVGRFDVGISGEDWFLMLDYL